MRGDEVSSTGLHGARTALNSLYSCFMETADMETAEQRVPVSKASQ